MVRDKATDALVPADMETFKAYMPELFAGETDVDIAAFHPLIDSSDIGPQSWCQIAQMIYDRYDDYDGFVVLHGTDTMSYPASAVSFMLENLGKPVVFTGSQLPVGVLRSDAKENLLTAIEIAAAKDEEGNAIMQTKRLAKGERKFKLAKSGKPFYLNEGTGIFVRPVEREEANLEIYAGLAGREVWVGNTWALDSYEDDVATIKLLNNVYEVGAEAGLTLKGYIKDRIVAYDLMARVIKPFYMPEETEKNYSKITVLDNGDVQYEYSELDSLQFETRFRLDLNLHKYVAFNYEINVKRDYAMVRKWQVSNALYLSLYYELDKKYN